MARPRLHFYVDRCSTRLPASCLLPLLQRCACAACGPREETQRLRLRLDHGEETAELVRPLPRPGAGVSGGGGGGGAGGGGGEIDVTEAYEVSRLAAPTSHP